MQIIRSEQIRQVPPKNALYYQQLKHQVFEMQLKKYSDNDPLLLQLLNPQPHYHTKQLIPPNLKRSFISKSPQITTKIQQRAKSCSCASQGYYCKKYKRLMDKGQLRIQHHKRMVIRRFRKFVHAILLVQTYFRYHPQRKQKKMRLRRMSQLRQRGSEKSINLNMLNKVSIDDSNATEQKQKSKFQTIHNEKNSISKKLLLHQSASYNKRPIWQFILHQNLHNSFVQRSARICRTEQSQLSPNKILNTQGSKNPYRSKQTSVLIRKYTKN